MSKLQKVVHSSWLLIMFLLALAGLVGYNAPQMSAQDNGTVPQKEIVYLPLISNNGRSVTNPTTPTATPTQVSNPNCDNPGKVWGFGDASRWTRESVGCGWALSEGDPVTIIVPKGHFLTTPFGQFCEGVKITVTSATLWTMGSEEPICESDPTPTPTATNTLVPTNTPMPTSTATATATTEPTAEFVCQNPFVAFGIGGSESNWTKESVGCGWSFLSNAEETFIVPVDHYMTSPQGAFCEGEEVTLSSGTLWYDPTAAKNCVPMTPTSTATATELPTEESTEEPLATATATATMMPTATATATMMPTATATATMMPTATATATMMPTATATATQQGWTWQQSMVVHSGNPNVVPCGDEPNCFKWNMNTQGPAATIDATIICATQGSYIDTDGREKYGLQANTRYPKLNGVTLRPCQ